LQLPAAALGSTLAARQPGVTPCRKLSFFHPHPIGNLGVLEPQAFNMWLAALEAMKSTHFFEVWLYHVVSTESTAY